MNLRGPAVPSFFLCILITKEQILELAFEHLKSTDKFVTHCTVLPGNHIEILIDGDTPVLISECVNLSRFIEKRFDREKEDFSLEVSSHGATNPLVNVRQYKKHIGKNLEIKLLDGNKEEGELTEIEESGIVIKYKLREKKPVGKGKITVEKTQSIPFNQIKETKIKLKF
jgi:ribosome maturation factor RimP